MLSLQCLKFRAPLALAAVLLVAQPVYARPSPAKPPVSAEALASLDAAVVDMVARHQSAGYAVALARGEEIFFIKSYGMADLENRVPVTPDTVFRVGSVTKQFTAAAILLLADRGKLSINDRLSKYLPDYPNADKVTLYQMLSHTSGLANYTGLEFFRSTMRLEGTTSEVVKAISGVSPQFEFEPGTATSYSNTGYYLLGAVIEKVSGQSYAEFMRTNIFEPLRLASTAVDDVQDIVPHRARGYVTSPETSSGFRNAPVDSLSLAGAAGAIRSTVRDLIKWNAALLGGKLLKPESLALMTQPARLADGRPTGSGWLPRHQPLPRADYGLGLGLGDDKGRAMIGHGGGISGFNAALFTYPSRGITLAILGNTNRATYQFAPRLADMLLLENGATPKP